ncbi:M67 family metallopeptidase [Chamaesiphon sp. OTE_75_metabat_556]|jgi:proteasome lid subunit RPN8/RPN11|uniref:M67 family metallopeptidase n=1 Tax=Chamaesiphon sp. OTE_75_metabat_556 TaxID=2964692 RepID=UPI00286D15FF|nr:M67 family metallopeptidase [Chamaesiphon sp. OTE_75_metabat_556]
MTILITTTQLQVIHQHAETIYPEECCGILLGTIDKFTKTVVEVIPTMNIWEPAESIDTPAASGELARTKTSRYTIPPQDILQSQKRGRDLNLNIVGFFHSHPDYPATPSVCDRDLAWYVYSYPIISVVDGKVTDLQSWVLDDLGVFQLEAIQQVDE